MKFSLKIEPEAVDTYVNVIAPRLNDEVLRLQTFVESGSGAPQRRMVGINGSAAAPLQLRQICRFYTADKKVYAQTANGNWQVRERMKDLESSLPATEFIRINQGEIVNLSFVERLDLSLSGTIGLRMKDGTRCFVARRSLKAFRTALNL